MKLVQNPVRPAATMPALMAPMMNEATKVPKIVPVPPNTEVPPRNTEARVFSMYPSPRVGQKKSTSALTTNPANAATSPTAAKVIIFVLPTSTPMSRALSMLSPVR
jgi:hypothetical protein